MYGRQFEAGFKYRGACGLEPCDASKNRWAMLLRTVGVLSESESVQTDWNPVSVCVCVFFVEGPFFGSCFTGKLRRTPPIL